MIFEISFYKVTFCEHSTYRRKLTLEGNNDLVILPNALLRRKLANNSTLNLKRRSKSVPEHLVLLISEISPW